MQEGMTSIESIKTKNNNNVKFTGDKNEDRTETLDNYNIQAKRLTGVKAN